MRIDFDWDPAKAASNCARSQHGAHHFGATTNP
jgi:hypothetical protein